MQFSGTSDVSRYAHYRRLLVEPLEDRRMLAVFAVDNLGDAGLGSLRQAILDANANIGADIVEFQAGLSGTIALTSGEMTITDALTIDGPGAAELTIDAQQSSRIFHMTRASGPVTFEGLTLTGGDAPGNGGAIFSETSALLAIQSSTISGNSTAAGFFGYGGGIFARGDVTVTGSTISGNSVTVYGGGIFARGDVTVTDSTISGNSAVADVSASGGGISAGGDVTVTDSTISGNSAVADVSAKGGGISARSDATVTNSTISGNSAVADVSARGGGIYARSDATVTNSTISGNSATGGVFGIGGGISANFSDVTVTGSTISGNSATGDSIANGGGVSADTGDVTVTGSMISGNSATSSSASNGGGIFTRGDVTVTDSTISGNSATGSFASGGGIRAFYGDVTVTDSTISGNSVAGGSAGGGGISTSGDVTVSASTIAGNSVTGIFFASGGGISASGDVTVSASTISDNSVTGSSDRGGGIFTTGNVTVSSSTISGNSVTGDFAGGGGILTSFDGDVTIASSTISGNSATGDVFGYGGGILSSGEVKITSSTISGNSATGGLIFGFVGGGGGIWVNNDPVTIENSIVAGNQTDRFAPDLRPGSGLLTVSYSLIGDNTDTGLAPAPVGMPDASGNLIGTSANPIDPLLGPLQDNGGPTFTHALLASSPAINAGDPGFLPPPGFDQRGDPFVRVFDGRIDMGAFELQPATLDEKIQQLLDTGVLNRGQANSLLVKLNSGGNERAQLNRLRAFINEVSALVRAGILSAEEGQCLIERAESLRNVLSVDMVLPSVVSSGRGGRRI